VPLRSETAVVVAVGRVGRVMPVGVGVGVGVVVRVVVTAEIWWRSGLPLTAAAAAAVGDLSF